MDQSQVNRYAERFRQLSDADILRNLADGPEAFRDGIYQVLLDEATQRGLNLEQARHDAGERSKRTKLQTVKVLTVWGYITAFAALGVPGIIIGARLRNLSKDPEIQGGTLAGINGNVISIISVIILLLGIAGIVYRIIASR